MRRGPKYSWKVILGIVLLIFSIFGIYSLMTGLESWFVDTFFLEIILIMLGFVFLREVIINIKEDWDEKWIDFIIALFLLFFGFFPLGLDLGLLTFLPFAIEFSVNPVVLIVVLLAFGAYLLLDIFMMFFKKVSYK